MASQLGGRPVFVRSSSNSEDLPNFSGAGLYSSVANVRDETKLIEAVKKVWASLWKFEAYEAAGAKLRQPDRCLYVGIGPAGDRHEQRRRNDNERPVR